MHFPPQRPRAQRGLSVRQPPKTPAGTSGAPDGPISEELLTKFLTNSDENGKGAATADNYAAEIMDGQRSPELILQRDALDELPEKPKPRSHPKYTFPPLSLLSKPVVPESTDISEELQTTASSSRP